MAGKALDVGLSHKEAKGNLRKYFDKLFLLHKKANNVKGYGEHFYIFRGETLITVFKMPNSLVGLFNKQYKLKRKKNGCFLEVLNKNISKELKIPVEVLCNIFIVDPVIKKRNEIIKKIEKEELRQYRRLASRLSFKVYRNYLKNTLKEL